MMEEKAVPRMLLHKTIIPLNALSHAQSIKGDDFLYILLCTKISAQVMIVEDYDELEARLKDNIVRC